MTTSMRSSLLTLQKMAKYQGITQLHLSSGLKVNSAIENPSSYYTAQSLSERAKLLSSFLDSIGQSIQQIKTTQTALQYGIKYLEQTQSIINTALENVGKKTEITKDWLIDNGVAEQDIVSSKDQLLDRLATANAGDTLVIFGNISMGDEEIILKEGVSLVGAQKVIDDAGAGNEFSVGDNQKTISFNRSNSCIGIKAANGSLISDLNINLTTDNKLVNGGAIYLSNSSNVIIRNVNIDFNDNSNSSTYNGAIHIEKSSVLFEGDININTYGTGQHTSGINGNRYGNISKLTVANTATINISTNNTWGVGIEYGEWDIRGSVNIHTQGSLSRGVNEIQNSKVSGSLKCLIDIQTSGASDIYSSKIDFSSNAYVALDNIHGSNSLNVSAGTILHFNKNNQTLVAVNPTAVTVWDYTQLLNSGNFEEAAGGQTLSRLIRDNNGLSVSPYYYSQYIDLLNQFDSLIKDGSYKGLNLLEGDSLSVRFNEDGSSKLDIQGVYANSDGLGLTKEEWSSPHTAQQSLLEIQNAINTLRGYSTDFGNKYSVLVTRDKFTENLINVLNEGADKLTLADMNEESANMLALQTRQQLAVSALSLSSQASQAILKLF